MKATLSHNWASPKPDNPAKAVSAADMNTHVLAGVIGADGLADLDHIGRNVIERFCSGLISGGELSINAQMTGVNIAAGSGEYNDHTGDPGTYGLVVWPDLADLAPAGNGTNYVAVHRDGSPLLSLTVPSDEIYVYLGHVYVINGFVIEKWFIPKWAGKFPDRVNDFVGEAIRVLVEGCGVVEGAPLSLMFGAGTLHCRLSKLDIQATTVFMKMANTADVGWVPDMADANLVNVTQYNDITKPNGQHLVVMADGWWKKDIVLRLPNGGARYVYSQAQYSTRSEANAAAPPVIPVDIVLDSAILAVIVSQKGDSSIAARLFDISPSLSRVFSLEVYPDRDYNIATGSTGWFSGGVVTVVAGRQLAIAHGYGYVNDGTQIKEIHWNAVASLVVAANTSGYVLVDINGAVLFQVNEPEYDDAIVLTRVATDANAIVFLPDYRVPISQPIPKLSEYFEKAVGIICRAYNDDMSPSLVVSLHGVNNSLQVNVSAGSYFLKFSEFDIAGGSPVSFNSFYKNAGGQTIPYANGQVNMDNANYCNAGVMAAIPAGQFVRHLLLAVKTPAGEQYVMVYGDTVYDSRNNAQAGSDPDYVGYLYLVACPIAAIIVQQNQLIPDGTYILDRRPLSGQFAL